MQVDDLLTFRQFSKKIADEAIDVSLFPVVVVSSNQRVMVVLRAVRRRCRQGHRGW